MREGGREGGREGEVSKKNTTCMCVPGLHCCSSAIPHPHPLPPFLTLTPHPSPSPLTCSSPAKAICWILRVKLKLRVVNLQVLWQVRQEQVGNEVPERHSDIVLLADDGVTRQCLSCTAVQLESNKLQSKEEMSLKTR